MVVMTTSVQVVVRVRPFLPRESSVGCVNVRENQIYVGEKRCFAFDAVLDANSSPSDVFETVGASHALDFYDGLNVAIIAYGQTGAGKTFTMSHLSTDLMDDVFRKLKEHGETLGEGGVSMKVSVVEVYNESLGDLLLAEGGGGRGCHSSGSNSASGNPDFTGGGLQLRELAKGGFHIPGLTEVDIYSREELQRLLDSATGNRKTASTLMNATSSRSHCVITVTLTRRGVVSKCCLVDLAGSERLKKSLGFAGGAGAASSLLPPEAAKMGESEVPLVMERAREGISINGGLLALGNVIVALYERRSHIPFRSSKLTRLLQPVLSGNCKTAMISCVSPLSSSFEETLNTLKYADRAKSIKTKPQFVVSDFPSAGDAETVILGLRKEIEELQKQLQGIQSSSGSPGSHSGSGGGGGTSPLLPMSPQLAPSPSSSSSMPGKPPLFPRVSAWELLETKAHLEAERVQTKRLENELFHAEYTAMVETEKRKAVEERLSEIEELLFAAQQQRSVLEDSKARLEESLRESQLVPAAVAVSTQADERERIAAIQLLENEKKELVEAKEQLEADVARLTASLATYQKKQEGVLKGNSGTTPQNPGHRSAAAEAALMDLVHEIERQQKGLRNASASSSSMKSEQNRLDIIQGKLKALCHCMSTSPASEKEPHHHSASLLSSTSSSATTTVPPVLQHQASPEVETLKHQLQRREEELAQVTERVQFKEGEIEVARKRRLSVLSDDVEDSAVVVGPTSTFSAVSRSRFQEGRTTGGRRKSDVSIITPRPSNKVQEEIEAELKILGDLEHEITELKRYEEVWNGAGFKDEKRWSLALKGYRKKLSAVVSELESASTEAQKAALQEKRLSIESRIRKVEVYQVVLDQAKLQLDEVNRRVESLDETRKFHLHRVLRLQNPGRSEDALDSSRDGYALPSVRDITTSRTRVQQQAAAAVASITTAKPGSLGKRAVQQ